jgi:hypothetical protein
MCHEGKEINGVPRPNQYPDTDQKTEADGGNSVSGCSNETTGSSARGFAVIDELHVSGGLDIAYAGSGDEVLRDSRRPLISTSG